MDVPVGMSITRIRMDIADARIPSSGSPAWPLVSEIESTRARQRGLRRQDDGLGRLDAHGRRPRQADGRRPQQRGHLDGHG